MAIVAGMPKKPGGKDAEGPGHLRIRENLNGPLNAAAHRHNSQKGMLVNDLIEWFLRAPPSMQQIVIGGVATDMKDEYLKRAVDFLTAELRNDCDDEPPVGGVARPAEAALDKSPLPTQPGVPKLKLSADGHSERDGRSKLPPPKDQPKSQRDGR